MNSIVSALRFFFTQTLDRPDLARRLVRLAHPRNLPVVLSRDEVARLLNATTLSPVPITWRRCCSQSRAIFRAALLQALSHHQASTARSGLTLCAASRAGVRTSGAIIVASSVAVIIAVGVNSGGRREVLGMEIGTIVIGFSAIRQRPPTATYFSSRNPSIPYFDPSRPMPDCFMPPKGAISLAIMPVLTPTMPASSASATRQMREMSLA